MGGGHDHGSGGVKYEKPLWWAFGLTAAFLIAEVIGGLLTNSLALLSDAAHMATDVVALAISLVAVWLSRKPPDARQTYGYARMEAIGALVNGGMLFLVAGYILWEAVGRFRQPPEVSSTGMLVIAGLGLIVNLFSMRLLKAGSGDSLNIKGAYLEVWADMLGSLGVIAGALVIRFTGWMWVDPIVAVGIGLWVLPRTWILLRDTTNILLEGVPRGIDLGGLRTALQAVPGVDGVHDLHVWSMATNDASCTVHLSISDSAETDRIRLDVEALLRDRFDITHSTVQTESDGAVCHPDSTHQ